jgi:hypothetical protein
MTTITPAPNGVVKIWGAVNNPRYSVSVGDGATNTELAQLVELAVTTFRLLGVRLTAGSVQGSSGSAGER